MTTWTVKRIVILVAAIVVGIFVLKEGFSTNLSQAITTGRPKASTSPRASGPLPSPTSTRKAKVKGVVVQVLNGSGTTGLAASTAQTLRSRGYKIFSVGNATTTPTTTIYYRVDSLPEAQLLQSRYFPTAPLKPAPARFSSQVQVVVVLGTDFVGSPSP